MACGGELEEENAKLERMLNPTLEGKALHIQGLKEKSSTYYKHVSFLADVLPRFENLLQARQLPGGRAAALRESNHPGEAGEGAR